MEETSYGQEQGQEYPQQPPQQPPQQYYPPEKKNFLEGMTTDDWLAKMVFVSFILLLLGMLLIHAAPFVTNYGSDAPDDYEDQLDDQATQNSMKYMGNILLDLGIFILSGFLLLAAFYRDDWGQWMRVAIAGFVLVLIVFGWFGISATLGIDASGLAVAVL